MYCSYSNCTLATYLKTAEEKVECYSSTVLVALIKKRQNVTALLYLWLL